MKNRIHRIAEDAQNPKNPAEAVKLDDEPRDESGSNANKAGWAAKEQSGHFARPLRVF